MPRFPGSLKAGEMGRVWAGPSDNAQPDRPFFSYCPISALEPKPPTLNRPQSPRRILIHTQIKLADPAALNLDPAPTSKTARL